MYVWLVTLYAFLNPVSDLLSPTYNEQHCVYQADPLSLVAVTTTSPTKTLYVMSDARLSALTKSILPQQPETGLGSLGVPSPSGGAVTFTTPALASTPSPSCTVVLSKQGTSKTVLLAPAVDQLCLPLSKPPVSGVETLGRVPSVLDEGSTILHTTETFGQTPGTTIITLSGSSVAASAGPQGPRAGQQY